MPVCVCVLNSAQLSDVANLTITPCVIAMVGLPARGKTYMSKKLTRYFNWIGIETKVFNVGEYRRRAITTFTSSDDVFNPCNLETLAIRELVSVVQDFHVGRKKCAKDALEDLVRWLHGGGKVAVYDATNSNRSRRQMINEYLSKEHGFKILFIESVCTDPAIIEANIREVKVSSPDYVSAQVDSAVDDFKKRIALYEAQYESIDEELDKHLSFIKIFDQGSSYLINRTQGHVQNRVVYYLMNIHILPRTIYITRAGECDFSISGKISREGELSKNGLKYASELGKFVERLNVSDLKVWTSLARHTVQTAANISPSITREHWKALSEIDPGIAEGLTYDEFQKQHAKEFLKRQQDKFHYRYPRGESYSDLVSRLEPVIMELERQENVLVICDQAVARCLLAYFKDIDTDELPYLEVPLHTVFKLTPVAYGCKCEELFLGVKGVSTQRPKPRAVVMTTLEERMSRRNRTSECSEPECCCVPRSATVLQA